MIRVGEGGPFIGIDHQLCLNSFGPKCMPELEALRCGAFAITVSHDDQGWRLHVLDVLDRRTLRVDGGIVVYGFAEEGNHPLVDGVLAVVALPVADACTRYGCFEACRLGYAKHHHEAAVAPSGESFAVLVDGEALLEHVHSSENVSQV